MSTSDLVGSDDRRNIELYTRLLAEHGGGARALNWGSEESQTLRFAVIRAVGITSGSTVLDVGSGLGDFYAWLCGEGVPVAYTGIDVTPSMVDRSRQRFPEVRFECGKLLETSLPETFDYVVASGIFYYRQDEPTAFMRRTVARMFELCRVATAFNTLSAWGNAREEGEFYADPVETLAFCRTLSPWVVLRHDYHPGDFTIYIYRSVRS